MAALTVYDMCKAVDRGMTIEAVRLEEKDGGKSGHFVREPSGGADFRLTVFTAGGYAFPGCDPTRKAWRGRTMGTATQWQPYRPLWTAGFPPPELTTGRSAPELAALALAPGRDRPRGSGNHLRARARQAPPRTVRPADRTPPPLPRQAAPLHAATAHGQGLREESPRQHHALAAVVEMIRTATLVHDDVLDEADLRRHARTFNAGWGNKVSILLGDMLFTHAFHLPSTVDVRACQIIGEVTNRACAGELRQVTERGNLELSEADYFTIIDGKTAALTGMLQGGSSALYAGASKRSTAKLANSGPLARPGVPDRRRRSRSDRQRRGSRVRRSAPTWQQKLTPPGDSLLAPTAECRVSG